ncbi:hypothetical protein [Limnohabitans sp.]|uniref:hypothetical protein n=1 Tax=Limnohabitans sp. TaxID=1907725 RepID=UPI00286F72DA|nr:hypothetical protein [Limnohabitans sp.]
MTMLQEIARTINNNSLAPTKACGRVEVDMNSVLYKALNPDRRWRVEFEYQHAPYVITVKASKEGIAVDVAETELWLSVGRPNLKWFSPRCVSCVEVSA